MANLQSLSSITTTATSLSNIVLVTPQTVVGYRPQNGVADNSATRASLYTQPPLLFHYEGEQSVVIENDITDHYIENNTTIQDQIAQKPDVITTHGFIGELNDVVPIGNALIQNLQSRLLAISAYTPALTLQALIAYNEAFQAYQIAANAVTSAVSSWATITGSGGAAVVGNQGLTSVNSLTQNKQQRMFQQFYGYKSKNVLFTVQTPWAVFQNMAILRLRAIQEAETNQISDFEITFKRLRLARLTTDRQDSNNIKDSPASDQSVEATQNSSTPPPATVSFSQGILGI